MATLKRTQFSPDQIARFEARRRMEMGLPPVDTTQPAQKTGGRGGFLSSLIQEGGAIGGATGGAALGTAILPGLGTLIGAGLGGFAGSLGGGLAESKIRDNKYDLGSNLKEAGIDAVLSAGPLKLAKGAKSATTALKGGVGLAEALRLGGKDAAEFTLREALGKSAEEAGKNLAIRPLGLAKGQKTAVRQLGRGGVTELADKYGIKSFEDIGKTIASQNQRYGELVSSIPGIAKSDLKSSLDEAVMKLSGAKSTANKAVAKSLRTESNNLLKQLPDVIDGPTLNTVKQEFDSLLTGAQQLANPAQHNVNKRIADSLRKTIQKSTGSDELKNIGLDLRALKKLEDVAAKNVEAGTGKSGFRASDFIAGSPFAASGNIPAALAAATTARAMSSPTTAKITSAGLKKAGAKLVKSGAKSNVAINAARNIGINSALGAGLGQSLEPQNSATMPTMAPQSIAQNNIDSIIPQELQNVQQGSIPQEKYLQAVMIDLAETGGKNLDQIKAVFQLLNPQSTAKGMNSTSANTVTDLQNGITNIQALGNEIAQSNANIPVIGNLLAGNPFNTEGQTLRADIARVKQVIGKALEGGVLRKEDEAKYAKILPTLNDTDAVAQSKINAIAEDLQRKLALYQQNLGGGGGGTTLESLLTQTQ